MDDLKKRVLKNRYFAMRHGQSEANIAGIIVSDPNVGCGKYGLTKLGQQQVIDSASNIKELNQDTFIISSDFLRAQNTAEITQKILNTTHPIQYSTVLRERFFGTLNDQNDTQYKKVWDLDNQNPDHKEFGVESANQVVSRVATLIMQLEEQGFNNALMRTYRGLAIAYEKVSSFQLAYENYKNYTSLLHQQMEEKSQQVTQELQVAFETQRYQADNHRLASENRDQEIKLLYREQILQMQKVAIGLVLVIIALIIFMWRRSFKQAQRMEKLATTDELTKLHNRRSIMSFGEMELNRFKRFNRNFSLLLLDIDFFKKVNDNYGHDAGDQVLVDFAQLLQKSFREYDIIGRMGGEEFSVCMPNTQMEDAIIACERMRKSVQGHITHFSMNEMISLSVTVSCGVVSAEGEQLHFNDLLRKADLGLYQAKNTGRNQTVNANEIDIEQTIPPGGNEEGKDNSGGVSGKYPGINFDIGVGNVLGDENLFQEILLMFYQDHHQDQEKIRKALDIEDILLAKHLAHTLKGVAASIGAMVLFERAKELDTAINHQEVHLYAQKLDMTEKELNKVLSGIQHITVIHSKHKFV